MNSITGISITIMSIRSTQIAPPTPLARSQLHSFHVDSQHHPASMTMSRVSVQEQDAGAVSQQDSDQRRDRVRPGGGTRVLRAVRAITLVTERMPVCRPTIRTPKPSGVLSAL